MINLELKYETFKKIRSMDFEAWPTDRRTKLYRDYVYTCHSNLH